jgi:RNA polymerase sigma-70 factor (ECF subfamily)
MRKRRKVHTIFELVMGQPVSIEQSRIAHFARNAHGKSGFDPAGLWKICLSRDPLRLVRTQRGGIDSMSSMGSEAETDLLARCRRGDAAAWDELFDRHYEAAARFVFQLGQDFSREDVEEICQEVFLSVIKNLDSFRGGSQFQTWLFRIAANKARDYRQHQLAAKRGGGQTTVSLQAEDPETGLTLDPPGTAPAPDAVLLGCEQASLVHQALDRLGDPCREIIQLRYFGELSYEEISRALELNLKTVSSRLSKCLDRLEEIARPIFTREKSGAFPSN